MRCRLGLSQLGDAPGARLAGGEVHAPGEIHGLVLLCDSAQSIQEGSGPSECRVNRINFLVALASRLSSAPFTQPENSVQTDHQRVCPPVDELPALGLLNVQCTARVEPLLSRLPPASSFPASRGRESGVAVAQRHMMERRSGAQANFLGTPGNVR